MKGKGSSSPRRFNVTAKDFTTRVKFQSALITFPRLLPLYRPDITTTAYCAFTPSHLLSTFCTRPHLSPPARDSNNYYRTYVARIARAARPQGLFLKPGVVCALRSQMQCSPGTQSREYARDMGRELARELTCPSAARKYGERRLAELVRVEFPVLENRV